MEPSDDFRPGLERLLTDHYMSWSSEHTKFRRAHIRVGPKIYEEFLRVIKTMPRVEEGSVKLCGDTRLIFKTSRIELHPNPLSPYTIEIKEDLSDQDASTEARS